MIVILQPARVQLFAISATVWAVAWIGQFHGHHVEGAKPAFTDDILFLLIGPLFVQRKLQRWVMTSSMQPKAG